MHHLNEVAPDAIENRIIAVRPAADAEMLMAGHQRATAWPITQSFTFFAHLAHE